MEKKNEKYCLNCNNILPIKKHKYCSNTCRRSINNRKNNPNKKYWKFMLNFLKYSNKTHFNFKEIALNYYESIHGNNQKNSIRKVIIKKYKGSISGMIRFLSFEKKLKPYNNANSNKRYYVSKELLKTIELIILGKYKGKKRKRTLDINNVDWIPFNQLTTFSLYFLCKLDVKVDNKFRELYNNISINN